jgi:hypothetical protein
MKKFLALFILGLWFSSNAYAHTSIHFSINQGMPAMMNAYDYEDMLLMEQIQARRMQNRMMRMAYPRYVRIVEPMYHNYYSYETPYYTTTRTVYTRHYAHQQMRHCHRRYC